MLFKTLSRHQPNLFVYCLLIAVLYIYSACVCLFDLVDACIHRNELLGSLRCATARRCYGDKK